MDSARSTELKVGILSFVGLVILILGLMWGKQRGLSKGEYVIRIHFPNSSGLIEGDPVSVNGVKKGRVTGVDVDNAGVLVHAELEPDVHLHTDATAQIMMLELMSGKKIEIQPGTGAAPFNTDSALNGTTSLDIPGAMSTIGSLSGDITRVLYRLDTLLASANHVMGDTVMIHSLRQTVLNLDATVSMTKTLVADNRENINTTMTNVKELVMEMKDFIEKNRATLDHAITAADKTLGDADAAIARADSTLAAVNQILGDVKNQNGAVGKMLYDKEFAARLDSTVTTVGKLMEFILANGININVRLGSRP